MTAYKQTEVTVSKSQEAIRMLLQKYGARGVQFGEDFETNEVSVRFAKLVADNLRTVSVSLKVPAPKLNKSSRATRWVRGRIVYSKTLHEKQEQLKRATFRAMHYWLKAQFESVEFGLLSFEDVFLAHFSWMVNGQETTIGALLRPALERPGYFLTAPVKGHHTSQNGSGGEMVEGEFTEG